MKTHKRNNIKIGSFVTSDAGDIYGTIYGLGLGAVPVVLAPQFSKDGGTYYRLIAEPETGAYEIGVAFPKDKNGFAWHAVTIDSPMFLASINAALFKDREKGAYSLMWSRNNEGSLEAETKSKPPARPAQNQPAPV